MAKIDRVQEISIDMLRPYPNNAKIHGAEQVEAIKRSIQEFGFISPCLIDGDMNVIAGHGRIMAARELGMGKVPCLFIEGLTEEQRKAYILADNKLTEMGEWDIELVTQELNEIHIDMGAFGFEVPDSNEWFESRDRWDDSREEGNDEYNEFLDKFEQPKTTDDCYTPDNIYEAVADYVSERFNRKRSSFVRPFYPNGDYQKESYPAGSVVVDNPPFSILAEIVDFYIENSIGFFLFAPCVSALHYVSRPGLCVMPLMVQVTYENGANVATAFLTNLRGDSIVMDNDPELRKAIEIENEKNLKAMRKEIPKFDYPADVITGAKAGWLSKYGAHIMVPKESCLLISSLDEQKETGKGIFGGGLLLSERAAQERAAQERAAQERAAQERAAQEKAKAHAFKLSEREKELQRALT